MKTITKFVTVLALLKVDGGNPSLQGQVFRTQIKPFPKMNHTVTGHSLLENSS